MKNIMNALGLIFTCSAIKAIAKNKYVKTVLLFSVMWILSKGMFTGILSMLAAAAVCMGVGCALFWLMMAAVVNSSRIQEFLSVRSMQQRASISYFANLINAFVVLHFTSFLCSGMTLHPCSTLCCIVAAIILARIYRREVAFDYE